MGIARLTAHLQPYAQSSVFAAHHHRSRRPSNDQRYCETAIVDGPALAYFAYARALALRSTARNALEAAPSYGEVGRIAVEWLAMLERHGFVVDAVYFDGALPVEKRPTRLSRLEACLKQLSAFRALHAANIPIASSRLPLADADIRDFCTLYPHPGKLKALPPLPFMVPAVIEALRESDFAAVTSVVTAEADVFCARRAAQIKAWVFTGDSDLLVYDIHPSSSVVFLHDVELRHTDQGNPVLNVTHFVPKEISARLSLPSLIPLAYAIHLDVHRSFSDCVRMARDQKDDQNFKTFKDNYVKPLHVESEIDDGNSRQNGVLRALDPRLSELIHQLAQESRAILPKEHYVYMPFLIDDPSRASAWNAGREIRRIAYSLLDAIFPSPDLGQFTTTAEYERRGPRIAASTLSPMVISEIRRASEALVKELAKWSSSEDQKLDPGRWRALALSLLLIPLSEEGKQLPLTTELANLICGYDIGTNWTYMHLSAQLQAVLYSFRILQQVSNIVESIAGDQESPAIITAVNPLLTSAVKSLPPLHILFPAVPKNNQEIGDRRVQSRPIVEALVESLQDQHSEEISEPLPTKKKRKRKAKQDKSHFEQTAIPKFASDNAFGLLLDE